MNNAQRKSKQRHDVDVLSSKAIVAELRANGHVLLAKFEDEYPEDVPVEKRYADASSYGCCIRQLCPAR